MLKATGDYLEAYGSKRIRAKLKKKVVIHLAVTMQCVKTAVELLNACV